MPERDEGRRARLRKLRSLLAAALAMVVGFSVIAAFWKLHQWVHAG